MKMAMNRAVITGMGAVSPLGNVNQMWNGLKSGQSGIRALQNQQDYIPVKIAGEVINFHPENYLGVKDIRRMPRVSQMAVVAAFEAMKDADLTTDYLAQLQTRAATVIGTTMGPHTLAEELTTAYRTNGHKRPNPIAFANCLPNMPAHYVSRYLKLHGSLHTPIAACATGTQAIGIAFDMIRLGRADLVVVGGSEAIVIDYVIAGFDSMQALVTGYENTPERASRPFDAERQGFVLSEGAGVIVIENLSHAKKRNANIHAEVVGFGSSADAYHIAVIDPEARGMRSAMQLALDDAQLKPDMIDYINAHGTSTPANDRLETLAIKHVFGNHAHDTLAISSNKSMLGHAMAAAGALEAIASVKTLQENVIPPTINYENADPECDLDYVPNDARQQSVEVVMSNNFGLGGQNASVIFKKWNGA